MVPGNLNYPPLTLILASIALLLLTGCKPGTDTRVAEDAQPPPIDIKLQRLIGGLDNPVAVTHAGDGSGRLFVTQQRGTVVIIHHGRQLDPPFLDIRPQVSCCGERGLLSIAFHPRFKHNGYVYVNYTNREGSTVISRFKTGASAGQVDPDSESTLLVIKQSAANHNGGQLQFGPDGYLYIGMGDGGSYGMSYDEDSAGDPNDRAQNKTDLLGKLLRIDIDGGAPYTIPTDNPFANDPDARGEIWALGLRNPWRFSFDRHNGDLFIGDVGELSREEINVQPADSRGGENYGWHRMEGTQCFYPSYDCDDGSLVKPAFEYDHYNGCAVIGGYRYRGRQNPSLYGVYLFADFCSTTIFGAWLIDDDGWVTTDIKHTGLEITSFGEDEQGELYVTAFGEDGGALYSILSITDYRQSEKRHGTEQPCCDR